MHDCLAEGGVQATWVPRKVFAASDRGTKRVNSYLCKARLRDRQETEALQGYRPCRGHLLLPMLEPRARHKSPDAGPQDFSAEQGLQWFSSAPESRLLTHMGYPLGGQQV